MALVQHEAFVRRCGAHTAAVDAASVLCVVQRPAIAAASNTGRAVVVQLATWVHRAPSMAHCRVSDRPRVQRVASWTRVVRRTLHRKHFCSFEDTIDRSIHCGANLRGDEL